MEKHSPCDASACILYCENDEQSSTSIHGIIYFSRWIRLGSFQIQTEWLGERLSKNLGHIYLGRSQIHRCWSISRCLSHCRYSGSRFPMHLPAIVICLFVSQNRQVRHYWKRTKSILHIATFHTPDQRKIEQLEVKIYTDGDTLISGQAA